MASTIVKNSSSKFNFFSEILGNLSSIIFELKILSAISKASSASSLPLTILVTSYANIFFASFISLIFKS